MCAYNFDEQNIDDCSYSQQFLKHFSQISTILDPYTDSEILICYIMMKYQKLHLLQHKQQNLCGAQSWRFL